MRKPLLPPVCQRSFKDMMHFVYDDLEDQLQKGFRTLKLDYEIKKEISVEEEIQELSIKEMETILDNIIPKYLGGGQGIGFGGMAANGKMTAFMKLLETRAYETPDIIDIAKKLIQLSPYYNGHEDIKKRVILNIKRYESSKVREKIYRGFLRLKEQLKEMALPHFQEMHARELLERADVLNQLNRLESLVFEKRTREITENKLEMGVDYRASFIRKIRNEKLGYPPEEAREIVPRTVYFESGFKPNVAVYPDISSSVYFSRLLPLIKKIALAANWSYSRFKDELDYVIKPFDSYVEKPLKGAEDIINLGPGYGTNTGGALDDGIRIKASSIVLITDGHTHFHGCYEKHGCSPQEYAYRKAREVKDNDIHLVAVCVHYGDIKSQYNSVLKRFIDNLARFSGGTSFHLTPSSFEIGCTRILYDVLEASLKPRIESPSSMIYSSY